jgi:phosphoribosylaminoimidazole-succinocarboxamide synthase
MTTLADAVFETHLPLPGRRQGKVRDVYQVPVAPGQAPRLLVVATDRVSAFDVVMPTPIPGKGRLLTEISLAWFRQLRAHAFVPDHLLGTDPADVPGLGEADRAMLAGRSMLCRAAKVVPIECVARGYLAGSGWEEYRASGTVCGVRLPAGLERSAELPEPIFTPATKAESGHDENVTFDQAAAAVGGEVMERLRALTPDSSRYWPLAGYAPGRDQPSFDKQYLRNWLLELVAKGAWHKAPPGPELPADVVEATVAKYREAARLLA